MHQQKLARPMTFLELEIAALASLGLAQVHPTPAEEERAGLARSRTLEIVNLKERNPDLSELQRAAIGNIRSIPDTPSSSRLKATSTVIQQLDEAGDLLELQKAALANMKAHVKPQEVIVDEDLKELQTVLMAKLNVEEPPQSLPSGDLLELQKVALDSTKHKERPPQVPAAEGLLKFQNVPMVSMPHIKKLPQAITTKGLPELQRAALANMRDYEEPLSESVDEDLLELQRASLAGMKVPGDSSQAAVAGKLLEPPKAARTNVRALDPSRAGRRWNMLQRAAIKKNMLVKEVPREREDKNFLEHQPTLLARTKLRDRLLQEKNKGAKVGNKQAPMASTHTAEEPSDGYWRGGAGGGELLELQKAALASIKAPDELPKQGDLLELQRAALASMPNAPTAISKNGENMGYLHAGQAATGSTKYQNEVELYKGQANFAREYSRKHLHHITGNICANQQLGPRQVKYSCSCPSASSLSQPLLKTKLVEHDSVKVGNPNPIYFCGCAAVQSSCGCPSILQLPQGTFLENNQDKGSDTKSFMKHTYTCLLSERSFENPAVQKKLEADALPKSQSPHDSVPASGDLENLLLEISIKDQLHKDLEEKNNKLMLQEQETQTKNREQCNTCDLNWLEENQRLFCMLDNANKQLSEKNKCIYQLKADMAIASGIMDYMRDCCIDAEIETNKAIADAEEIHAQLALAWKTIKRFETDPNSEQTFDHEKHSQLAEDGCRAITQNLHDSSTDYHSTVECSPWTLKSIHTERQGRTTRKFSMQETQKKAGKDKQILAELRQLESVHYKLQPQNRTETPSERVRRNDEVMEELWQKDSSRKEYNIKLQDWTRTNKTLMDDQWWVESSRTRMQVQAENDIHDWEKQDLIAELNTLWVDLEHKTKQASDLHNQLLQLQDVLAQERESHAQDLEQEVRHSCSTVAHATAEFKEAAVELDLFRVEASAEISSLRSAMTAQAMNFEAMLDKHKKTDAENYAEYKKIEQALSDGYRMDIERVEKRHGEKLTQIQREWEEKLGRAEREYEKKLMHRDTQCEEEKQELTRSMEDLQSNLAFKDSKIKELSSEISHVTLSLKRSKESNGRLAQELSLLDSSSIVSPSLPLKNETREEEILIELQDAKYEIASLQGLLQLKSEGIKIVEKELNKSYGTIEELRVQCRGLQETEHCLRKQLRSKDQDYLTEARPQRVREPSNVQSMTVSAHVYVELQKEMKTMIDRVRIQNEHLKVVGREKESLLQSVQNLSAKCKELEEINFRLCNGSHQLPFQEGPALVLKEESMQANEALEQLHGCTEHKVPPKQGQAKTQLNCVHAQIPAAWQVPASADHAGWMNLPSGKEGQDLRGNTRHINKGDSGTYTWQPAAYFDQEQNGLHDTCDKLHWQIQQLQREKQALADERDELLSELHKAAKTDDRKDEKLKKLQGVFKRQKARSKQVHFKASPWIEQRRNSLESPSQTGICKVTKLKTEKFCPADTNSFDDPGMNCVNILHLRENLTEQWNLHCIMEERLNSMLAYVIDRAKEFDQMTHSKLATTAEVRHSQEEAKYMQSHLERQLQFLQATLSSSFARLVAGQKQLGKINAERDILLTDLEYKALKLNETKKQNTQLLIEKIALETSTRLLQHKTFRVLNRLTNIRIHWGQGYAAIRDVSD